MANYRIHHKPGVIKDGKLDRTCGRIIIFDEDMVFSRDYMSDHNYLLRAFAARFQVDKHTVISKAIRLYFAIADFENMIISGVRKIDDNDFENKIDFYVQMINCNFK